MLIDKQFITTSEKIYFDPTSVSVPTDFAHILAKRVFDIVIAGLVTIFILIWLIPVVGLLIKLTSPGPIMFMQLRTGKDGKPIWILKFRTMKYEPNAPFTQATPIDKRITPIGRFLRRSYLDEMPQFLNVLAGNMSIVGPRPHPLPLDAKHWDTMPGYQKRYVVKPGITGLAQIRGARGETDKDIKMKHRVQYDQFYIARQSLRFDITILYQTIILLLKGEASLSIPNKISWSDWNFNSNTVFSTATGGAMLGSSLYGIKEAVFGGIAGAFIGAWSERTRKN